ncbi:MAG TPA: LysM peptidoglycan-binding domain-containing protein [Leptolinea sp.]
MNRNPTLIEGLGIALLVALLVIIGIMLAGVENLGLNQNNTPSVVPTILEINPIATDTPVEEILSPTEMPTLTLCPQPEGWLPYVIQSGDSLELLAGERLTDLNSVMNGNCLTRPGALPGSTIYLPPPPPTLTPTITTTPTITLTATATLRPCEYPEGWVRYSLKSGDTIFKLGVRYRVSEADLITGNCLSFGTALHAGDILLVPVLPTVTATPKK